MKILINYANWRSALVRPYNSLTGRLIGGADRVIEYSPRDLPGDFRRRNRKLLRRIHGGGYWVWKPWIILETFKSMSEDDILLYSDADIFFLRSIDPLLERMEETGQDVMAFSLPKTGFFLEKHWTKRDVFQRLDCDSPEYTDTAQTMSGFHLWKKTGFSMGLAREWLDYTQDERLTDDSPSRLPNYPGFRGNRHDQSIFSPLLKKRRLLSHRDPSQHGIGQESDFPDDRYPQIILIAKEPELKLTGSGLRSLRREVLWPGRIALARSWCGDQVRMISGKYGKSLRKIARRAGK